MLSLAYVMSYLDRIIINLLVVPIQSDLGINDTQFGLLQSVAFGIFYTVMALPLGLMADRYHRKWIIAGGIGLFSLFTVLSGTARAYTQLFMARIGVGVGEASLTPAAYSLLADSFEPHRLGRAIGTFTMSAFVGTSLAYIGGGAAIDWLHSMGPQRLPLLGELQPWQMAFLLVGIPGFIIAPLVLTLREPERKGGGAVPIATAIAAVRVRGKALVLLFSGFSFITLSSYASAVWTPAFFIRVYEWQPGQIGLWYGLIYLSFGTSGALFGGWLCDRLTVRGVKDAPLRVAAYGYFGTMFFGGLAPLMPTPELALLLSAPATFMGTLPYPLAGTAIALITPNQLRGQVTALYMLVINLVGLGMGPMLVGVFTDFVFTQPEDVRYSLAIINAGAAPLAVLLLILALPSYRRLRRIPEIQKI